MFEDREKRAGRMPAALFRTGFFQVTGPVACLTTMLATAGKAAAAGSLPLSPAPSLPATGMFSDERIVFVLLLALFLSLAVAGFALSRRSARDALKAESRRFEWRD